MILSFITYQPFYYQIFKLNGELFDRALSAEDLLEIWKLIGGEKDNLKQQSCEPQFGRCLAVTYILVDPIRLLSLSPSEEFNFEKKGTLRTDIFRARLVDFGTIEYKLGDLVPVTFLKTFFKASHSDMKDWLAPFGETEGEFR